MKANISIAELIEFEKWLREVAHSECDLMHHGWQKYEKLADAIKEFLK